MRLAHPSIRRLHGLTRHVKAIATLAASRRTLLTLAIETSCDDTAVAIVEKAGSRARLYFNERITAHQGRLKGIHPIIAQESHEARLGALVNKAVRCLPDVMEPASHNRSVTFVNNGVVVSKRMPDFVSVTRGPGMRSSLGIGLNVAKGLSVAWQIPLVGVHHMQAHALTPRLVHALNTIDVDCDTPDVERTAAALKPSFPYLTLLVSGGHTMLVRTTDLTMHQISVQTADYALGDCLDKAGRAILPEDVVLASASPSYGALLESFAFPDGPATFASQSWDGQGKTASKDFGWQIPVPYNSPRGGLLPKWPVFSFTGIESQASRIAMYGFDKQRRKFKKQPRSEPMPEPEARSLAQEVMRVAFEHLAGHVTRALKEEECAGLPRSKTLVLSGGVASNQYLRHVMKTHCAARGYDIDIVAPPPGLCTDNAAMIGWTGCEMYEQGHVDDLDIRCLGKWSLEHITDPAAEADGRNWLENNPDAQA